MTQIYSGSGGQKSKMLVPSGGPKGESVSCLSQLLEAEGFFFFFNPFTEEEKRCLIFLLYKE